MAHFAKLDENNIVIDVNVLNNEIINNLPFPESEPLGVQFLTEWSNGYTNWKQTSFNNNFRANFASIGYVYDATNNVFIAPQPYPSWVLNTIWQWEAPIPYPTDGKLYWWNEATVSWRIAPTESSGNINTTIL
jgi:hypothetical protein